VKSHGIAKMSSLHKFQTASLATQIDVFLSSVHRRALPPYADAGTGAAHGDDSGKEPQ
jgi:hypothetical protein